ncbi:MAG: right-handed parallel beta-helix repeat-containing protein [Kiritimatiellae bacterium]|nr:right-handed parallel beta-helix repeat-containing protein [Kiritimatiellia bacterium]
MDADQKIEELADGSSVSHGIRTSVFDPRDFGAKGDGLAKDTAAIQRAIDECSRFGGGRVVLSRGRFLSGMVSLKDGVDLHIDASAVLLGSEDDADFPTNAPSAILDPCKTCRGRTTALVVADGCRNVALTGRGRIDCNGMAYVQLSNSRGYGYENEGNAGDDAKPLGDDEWVNWRYRRIPGKLGPPRMVLFAGCQDVLVEDVSLVNPAAGWGYWVTGCERVVFERAKVLANPDMPNNDGIHLNASTDISISNCRIVAGDDAIVVRCNNRPFRDGLNRVCERVTVSNCQLTSHANAIRIGWLNDGVVRNCVFTNLAVTDSACGIGIDLPPFEKGMDDYGREASLYENLVFSTIVMDRVYSSPVRFDITGEEATRMEAIRAITFSDIRARAYKFPDLRAGGGRAVEDVVFRGCAFTRCADGAFPGDWRQKGAAYWWNEGREDFPGLKGVRYEGCTFTDEAAKRAPSTDSFE